MTLEAVPVLLMLVAALVLSVSLLIVGRLIGPRRGGAVKEMPYESGMDPVHGTHRRFDVRFYMVAIAFLIFDVELLFLYPWAVARTNDAGLHAAIQTEVRDQPTVSSAALMTDHVAERTTIVFWGVAVFFIVLALGFVYDWRKGIFQWR